MLDLGKYSEFRFCYVFGGFLDPVVLNSCLLISSPGAVPKDAVQLAPAKALKTGARNTPHTAPQPLPAVDLEAAAARLREAMARGAQAVQQARAQEEGDAGQSGAKAATPAADAEETGRGGAGGAAQAAIEVEAGQGDAASAARPDTEGEAGGDAQERPAGQAEEDTLVFEPSRGGSVTRARRSATRKRSMSARSG